MLRSAARPHSTPVARAAAAHELPALAACLGRAFETDPVLRWMIPDAGQRSARAPRFYRAVLAYLAPSSLILTTEEQAGVAVWQAPRPPRAGLIAELRYTLRLLGSLRGGAWRGMRLVSAIEAVHPPGPHWYLSILATDPCRQGRGIGAQLLRSVLRRCDRDRLPAYLESSKESNIPFYAKHGFAVVGEVRVAGGPTLWPMLRQPGGE